MELPFKLYKYHKYRTISTWKKRGLKETDEFIEEIYNRYIIATHCELCNNEFISSSDRCMEHNKETGKFRNIACTKCNQRKHDVKMRSDNTSGYKGISKQKSKSCKQGFYWAFHAVVNGKLKLIKSSTNLDFLKTWVDKWKIENNYHT